VTYYLDSEKTWNLAEVDLDISRKLQEEGGLSNLTSIFLANRGIRNAAEAGVFLNPSAKILSEPTLLPDIKEAAQRIKQAINDNELIYIHGDYDVDGITSTTLLYEVLLRLKADVRYHIPCRFKEGYGLNIKSLNKIINEGAKLLITVDCGIKSFKEVAFARKKGLDVIITDHHEPAATWPEAIAVVNPKLPHAETEDRSLAGVGVALKLAQLLADDSLEDLYDLVALGTVADIAPLINENRYLTKSGLKTLNLNNRLGLSFLAKAAGVEKRRVTSELVGYTLAPRLNASGRISNANICVELLSTNDEAKAQEIALKLEESNRKRQQLEEKMLEAVLKKVEAEVNLDKERVIFLADEGWHDGIKGIIASRIKERFFRPAFIGTITDGKIKASARSIPNYSIHQALENCSELLIDFGGHEKAGGLTLSTGKAGEMKARLNELAEEWLDEKDLHPTVFVDAKSRLADFDFKFGLELKKLAPYGEGNPQPKLLLEEVYLQNQQKLGKNGNHLRFDIYRDDKKIPAVAFGLQAFATVLNHRGQADIVVQPGINDFALREELQLKMVDLKLRSVAYDNPQSVVEHLFANAVNLAAKEEYKNIGDSESFFTKLAGVTFDGRQEIIDKLKPSSPLNLKREPENEHDSNAIRVLTPAGVDLGFLNRNLAKQLAPLMDAGGQFECRVTDVTGGGGKNYGVNILVRKYEYANQLKVENEKPKAAYKNTKQALEAITKTLLPSGSFHPYQHSALNHLLEGENTLTIMGTGRGKSLIFHTVAAYKALLENKMSIFLYPLRSLITDQYLYLKEALSGLGLNVVRLWGDCSLAEREKIFAALAQGQIDIVLTTPEFLHHNIEAFRVCAQRIGFLVVDEAHHISTAGKTHRPLYASIDKLLPLLGSPLVMAATATADEKTCNKITSILNIKQVVVDPTVRENLELEDKRGVSSKEPYLQKLINKSNKMLIYVNSRAEAAKLAANLRYLAKDCKDKIVYYHAGLSSKLRSAVQEGFMDSTFKVVVATSAFGEGVNIADIDNLVLFHLPFSFVEYNQQSGRCGRDGNKAAIHLIFGEDDARINELILESKAPSRNTLSAVWQTLSFMANKDAKIFGASSDIAAQVSAEQPSAALNKTTVASSLKIFIELGLIEVGSESSRAGSPNTPQIVLKKGHKVDLSDSVIYEEGLHEKQQFAEFKQWALGAGCSELLKMINQPIYPKKDEKYRDADKADKIIYS